MNPPKIARTLSALAVACGTTRKTIGSWLKKADCPGRRADGSFSVTRWKQWISETELGSRSASADRNPRLQALKNEKLRLQTIKIGLQAEVIALQTEHLALQNRVARGELLSEQEVCRVVGDLWGKMIAQLRQMKNRVSTQVCGLDSGSAARILREDMRACLREFSIPRGLEKHPFFGPLREQLEELHAEIEEGV